MKKRILFGVVVALGAVATLPLFSAFEAHVINVTAQIENALQVTTHAIDFGTVFPQEHLDQTLGIALSRSFFDEERVDDVEYIIRQKPKCGVTINEGTVLVGPTATGHPSLDATDKLVIDCGPAPRPLTPDDTSTENVNETETWGVLPSLCEYISKEGEDQNDATLPSFHQPWTFRNHQLVWNDVHGRLAKSENDISDTWTIDLAVPCFGGYCAQDWADFVHRVSASSTIDASEYTQPIENEHKVFGCDLWVEVTHVSEFEEDTNP